MGAANKVSGNKIRGKEKSRIVNHAFSLVRGIFCIKSYWSQKKVLENKVSNWQDFISGDFLIKGLFSTGLF